MNMSVLLHAARSSALASGLHACTIRAYDGAMPAAGGALDSSHTMLAMWVYTGSVGTSSGGQLVFDRIVSMASASGQPTFVRATTPGDEWLFDLAVGAGTPISIVPAHIYAGGEVSFNLSLNEF